MEQTTDEKLRYAEMWRQQQLMNNGCGTPMVYLLLAVFIMCLMSCATKKEVIKDRLGDGDYILISKDAYLFIERKKREQKQ